MRSTGTRRMRVSGIERLQPVAYHKCKMQTSKVLNIRSITNILNILNILAPSAHPRADAQHRRTPDTGLHIACTLSNGKFMFKDGTITFFFTVCHMTSFFTACCDRIRARGACTRARSVRSAHLVPRPRNATILYTHYNST